MKEDRNTAYAEALYDIAHAESPTGEVEDELFRFARVLEGNEELQTKLSDAQIPAAKRQQIVEDLLDGKAESATIGLVSLLVGNGRAKDIPAIVDRVVSMSAAAANKETAEVRTAFPLSDDEEARVAKALGEATGKELDLRVIIDPSVKGGLVAQIGDTVIDGSVRRRLDQLRNVL